MFFTLMLRSWHQPGSDGFMPRHSGTTDVHDKNVTQLSSSIFKTSVGDQEKNDFASQLLQASAGACAGIIAMSATYPMDMYHFEQQMYVNQTSDEWKRVVKKPSTYTYTSGRLQKRSTDGSIRIWDSDKGTCETTLNGHKGATSAFVGFDQDKAAPSTSTSFLETGRPHNLNTNKAVSNRDVHGLCSELSSVNVNSNLKDSYFTQDSDKLLFSPNSINSSLGKHFPQDSEYCKDHSTTPAFWEDIIVDDMLNKDFDQQQFCKGTNNLASGHHSPHYLQNPNQSNHELKHQNQICNQNHLRKQAIWDPKQLPTYLAAAEWQNRHAALVALAQIAEGCSKVMVKKFGASGGYGLCSRSLVDVITNLISLIAALLANYFDDRMDPVGAIIRALYIIRTWSMTVLENVNSLVGRSAAPEYLQKLTYLCWNHHKAVRHIDTVRAYTFGSHYFVEVDIVLPAGMPLQEAHDIGESLQEKLELLPEIERAFVHLDYEYSHKSEHAQAHS
ncbi:Metal tolerance protein 11 [Lathyrus oleraceus]|uniref:Metal tolerance protein 11 n=2 Tax=Pisum sativum TaxID=3888 RepID=A0A9D5B2V4_PEA|nr:Metal tolerance protein 11 [Pisum sativum]